MRLYSGGRVTNISKIVVNLCRWAFMTVRYHISTLSKEYRQELKCVRSAIGGFTVLLPEKGGRSCCILPQKWCRIGLQTHDWRHQCWILPLAINYASSQRA